MTFRGAVGVLRHDFFEEGGNVVLCRRYVRPDILTVIMAGFERVVLHRDESKSTSSNPGFSGGHLDVPFWDMTSSADAVPITSHPYT